jgi:two-component system chemotaxis response regulator CheY
MKRSGAGTALGPRTVPGTGTLRRLMHSASVEDQLGKTLVVDDFATMRKIVKNVLRQIDITDVAEAENGKVALDALKKDPNGFELIVSDWIMPEMTGIDFLKACKEDEAIKKIPFVMVTAEAQKVSVLEAIKAGADNYIVKPFTPDKLQEAIQKAKDRVNRQ